MVQWAKDCLAKANYCGWAATVTTDKTIAPIYGCWLLNGKR